MEAFGNPILQDNHDNRVEAFRKVSDVAKAHGSLFIAQLSHPGRQGGAALNPNPVSASDVQLNLAWAGNTFNKPRALTVPEIKALVKVWGETAYLCYQAGFDGEFRIQEIALYDRDSTLESMIYTRSVC